MKSGISENSSPKKRGRQKGWTKAKAQAEKDAKAKAILQGNPDFNVKDPEVQKTIAAFTDEDLALDRELDQIAAQRPQVSDVETAASIAPLKIKENLEHLRAHVEGEYLPASTIAELTEQVHVAKTMGADSIDATEALFKQVFRADFDKIKANPGYGIYHDIRVYMPEMFEQTKHLTNQTMEQKLFPKK